MSAQPIRIQGQSNKSTNLLSRQHASAHFVKVSSIMFRERACCSSRSCQAGHWAWTHKSVTRTCRRSRRVCIRQMAKTRLRNQRLGRSAAQKHNLTQIHPSNKENVALCPQQPVLSKPMVREMATLKKALKSIEAQQHSAKERSMKNLTRLQNEQKKVLHAQQRTCLLEGHL
jgi:hypothetical protein